MKNYGFYTLVLIIDFTLTGTMKLSSNKMFHDKMILKMNGGMKQLSWFLLESGFVTFWISDICQNLMEGMELLSRKCKYA